MERNISIFLSILLTLFVSSISTQCVPTNNPNVTKLNGPLLTPTYVITFDDIGVLPPWVAQPWDTWRQVSNHPNQSVALFAQGAYSQCSINNYANLSPWFWFGSGYWSGSTTEKVGAFLHGIRSSPAYSICTLQFIPPINAFVARATATESVDWLTIYDPDSKPLDCQPIPSVPGTNAYAEIGFASDEPIGFINFIMGSSQSTYFVDNIQFQSCELGFKFNKSDMSCYDIDECLDDPCGAHASCLNTNGSYSCSCDNGYEMNNGTCVEIDLCGTLSPCSEYATCANVNGSFTCTCNEGYQGDGVGQNGCQPTQSPTDSNSPSNNNNNNPSATPNKPDSPSSSIVSSSDIVAVNSMLFFISTLLILAL